MFPPVASSIISMTLELQISLLAGKEGLNLQFCQRAIFMEPDFNPSSEEQATDRLHRIGQLRDVHIHKFFIKGTRQELLLSCQCCLTNAPGDAASSLLV